LATALSLAREAALVASLIHARDWMSFAISVSISVDHLQGAFLAGLAEGDLDVLLAEGFAELAVDELDAGSPAGRLFLNAEEGLLPEVEILSGEGCGEQRGGVFEDAPGKVGLKVGKVRRGDDGAHAFDEFGHAHVDGRDGDAFVAEEGFPGEGGGHRFESGDGGDVVALLGSRRETRSAETLASAVRGP